MSNKPDRLTVEEWNEWQKQKAGRLSIELLEALELTEEECHQNYNDLSMAHIILRSSPSDDPVRVGNQHDLNILTTYLMRRFKLCGNTSAMMDRMPIGTWHTLWVEKRMGEI